MLTVKQKGDPLSGIILGVAALLFFSYFLMTDGWDLYLRIQLKPRLAAQGIVTQARVKGCGYKGVLTLQYTTIQTLTNGETLTQAQEFSFSTVCAGYREAEPVTLRYLPEYPTLPNVEGEDLIAYARTHTLFNIAGLVYALVATIKSGLDYRREARHKGVTLAKKEEV